MERIVASLHECALQREEGLAPRPWSFLRNNNKKASIPLDCALIIFFFF